MNDRTVAYFDALEGLDAPLVDKGPVRGPQVDDPDRGFFPMDEGGVDARDGEVVELCTLCTGVAAGGEQERRGRGGARGG